ncbi:MAG: hypothetical protein NTY19_21060 [Planctomycetota bacterium]|nr:hypothetical protein [Planctomycetota bacterium]
MKHTFTLLTVLLLAPPTALHAAERVTDKVDWPAFMARHDLVWERLPGKWTEAPHFGNATLGSMLFRSGEAFTLQVFRAGVCDHRDNSYGWTAYSRPRFTIGAFQFKPVGKIKGGAWRNDLWNAELTGTIQTDRGTIRLRHFVHADEMAIVTEIWTSPGEAGYQWTWQPHKAETTRPGYPSKPAEIEAFAKKYGDVFRKGLKLGEPNPDGRQEAAGAVRVWVQDLLCGGQYATAWADVDKGGGHRVHVATIADSYPAKTARDKAVKIVADWSQRDMDAATATHREWWHQYYRQSFVSLPDTRLETLYWNTIFRFGCTARTGRYIVDTPGIWSQGGGWCYITTDYNIQTALWPVYAANRLEIGGELIEMFHHGRENLARNVRPVEWQNDSVYLSVATEPDMIYPLYLVNIDQPGKREVVRKSVERFAATKGLPAMVATHAVPAAASIGDGELALSRLQKQAADLYPNGMWYSSPCLESSLSAANGIQTMLLQSWGDNIRIFPAMPATWPDVVYHNLRAEGAFLVSARRAGGKTQWVCIKSLAGEPCRVKPNFTGEPRIVAGAANAAIKSVGDGVYELILAKGQEVVLIVDGEAPFIVDALPAQADRLNSFGLRAAKEKLSSP